MEKTQIKEFANINDTEIFLNEFYKDHNVTKKDITFIKTEENFRIFLVIDYN